MTMTDRLTARTTGLALLTMTVLAPWAALAATGSDSSAATLRLAGTVLLVVAALDVVVAWGLWQLLAPAARRLAALTAAVRIGYAAAFTVAIVRLFSGTTEGARQFDEGWHAGLALFGVHLLLLGTLLWVATTGRTTTGRGATALSSTRPWLPRTVAVLVLFAGVGYLADRLAALVGSDLSIGQVTFVGELVLMGWLLAIGLRRDSRPPVPAAA